MAIVKTLIVKGVARFLTDAYMSTIRSGIWNGSTIQVGYGGTGVTSAKGDLYTPVFLSSSGIAACSAAIPHNTKDFKINGTTYSIFTTYTGTAPTIFAPTTLAGTGGYILATNAAKTGLEWVAKPAANVTTTAVVAAAADGTTQISAAQSNPFYNLLEGGTVTRSIQFKAGTGITISASTGGVITITNSAPDVNHNTDHRKAFYGTCETAAGTAAKVVAISDVTGWELREGTIVGVKFTNSNTASSVTLNVNSSGAKSIFYDTAVYTSTSADVCGKAGRLTYYMYDGTNWVWLGSGYVINTTYSAGTAALIQAGTDTANRVWQAKILQDEFVSKRGDTMTGALTIKGVADSGQYSQGGFNKAYANIMLLGDSTYGVSGIVFKSMKGDTNINTPSDVAFIQYHPYGVTAARYNATPTEASTGELSRLVIGIGNDDGSSNGEELWLQTPGKTSLKHLVTPPGGSTDSALYTIADAGNISNKAATIGSSLTTIATIAGVNITAKIPDVTAQAIELASVEKTLAVSTWTDMGAVSSYTGTYAIQISSGNVYASGVFTACGGTDSVIDEIPLHVADKGTNTWRPYARIKAGQLQMTTNEATGTSREYTIKILKLI